MTDNEPAPGENDGNDGIDAMVRGLDVARPPADFADRVMAARAEEQRARARVRFLAGMGASALAGAAACFVVVTMTTAGTGAWGWGGGQPHHVVITTPAGTLAGVQFSADLNPINPINPIAMEKDMFASPSPSSFPKTIATAAAGMIAGAALTVAVSAGELTVENDTGTITVKPGEVATVVAGAAPTKERGISPQERVHQLQSENEGLRAALEAARSASASGDVTRLVGENQQLRDKLKKADEEVALLDDLRKAQEGEPQTKFPDDLPPRFAEASLQRSFEEALDEVGIEGGIVEIDCKEYPCIVYGQLSSRHDMDKLRDANALAAYKDDDNATSVWHTKKVDDDGKETELVYFGVASTPKPADPEAHDEEDEALDTRTGFRMQQMAERLFPRK